MDKGHESLVLEHLNKGRGAGPVINPLVQLQKLLHLVMLTSMWNCMENYRGTIY